MALASPEWLTRRGGALKLGSDGQTWFVMLNAQPQFALTVVPVEGKFGSTIKQTNNGHRIANTGVQASPEEAIAGGLEDLRKSLGW
jgi:hypothetical protein